MLLLTQIPLPIYLLVFMSALPMTRAGSSESPFPDISFKDFNKFVNSNFNPQVSLSTVLLVMFTMTENSDLLNLHARQKNPQCNGELKQSSSGWMRALAQSLMDRLEKTTNNLFTESEYLETKSFFQVWKIEEKTSANLSSGNYCCSYHLSSINGM